MGSSGQYSHDTSLSAQMFLFHEDINDYNNEV